MLDSWQAFRVGDANRIKKWLGATRPASEASKRLSRRRHRGLSLPRKSLPPKYFYEPAAAGCSSDLPAARVYLTRASLR